LFTGQLILFFYYIWDRPVGAQPGLGWTIHLGWGRYGSEREATNLSSLMWWGAIAFAILGVLIGVSVLQLNPSPGRIVAGDIDPTAGVMFQVDAKGRNGYVVRVSGERNELIVHYLIYGKRRDLRFAKIPPIQPGTWHTLSVERKGSIMAVSYDGEEKLRIRDERYSGGSVGLWTEDDTVVDFEQLAVSKR